jgi:hypothetical protein
MFLADLLTLDAPRRTGEGYLAVRAKAARKGVYRYTGREVDPDNKHGLRDAETVNVLRDEATVFDKKAVHSFIGKPITDDHPTVAVDAANWRDHARGVVMGAEWQEGGYLAFDLLLTDAAAISAVEGGKRQLSNGYAAELEFGKFVADDGTECPVRQSSIRGNHVAIVDRGRAGDACAIADSARCTSLPADAFELLLDGQTYADPNESDKNARQRRETVDKGVGQVATKIIIVDGLNVEVTEDAERAIVKLQGQLADSASAKEASDKALKDEQAKIVERDATITAKDAKIVELEKKLEDAAITPAKLQDAAKAYADVCAKAKALGVTHAEDADIDAVRKAVVDAKMGDAAKDYSADHIAIAFDALTKDAKADPLRNALKDGIKATTEDSALQDAYSDMVDELTGAWKQKQDA